MATANDIPFASLKITEELPAEATSAAHQVFAIVELTENILNQGIGMAQLFTLRRVNRHFDSVINNSLPVQQKMFVVHTHDGTDKTQPVRFNPLLVHVQKLFPFQVYRFTYKKSAAAGDAWLFSLTLLNLPRRLSVKAQPILEAARTGSMGVLSTKVASASLKLSGEVIFRNGGLLQERMDSLLALEGTASLEQMAAAFIKEVGRRIGEENEAIKARGEERATDPVMLDANGT
ncbi:hypothetical protein LTR95_013682 [Oleoguttula sp. CCFEE 5521]